MDKDLEIKRRLVVLLDELLEKDYWQDSLFLKAAEKEIRELRTRIISDPRLKDFSGEPLQTPSQTIQNSANVPVYVALYQADGTNFVKWAQVLSALPALSISRPIYKNESDIKTCMRAIEKKQNHGYAIVMVEPKDILSQPGNSPKDRNGFELLIIKEKSIKLENIASFIHVTGNYSFVNGQLTYQGSVDSNQ